MILEKQSDVIILEEGDSKSTIKSKLDIESADFLMKMMTKGFYSDGEGSTVRETASNGIDSHRKANISDPVVVSLQPDKQGNWEYSVEDVGLGLDHETVENVIALYGKSTKRDDNNAIGCMGLGWKSPLSYSSSFYFITRKDGIERKYMQSESEEGGSDIDLLYESETSERNGVKVIVPIKWSDRSNFVSAIKRQLAYFKDVYFKVDGINNDFKIFRSNDFQWSELSDDKDLHICLDDCYYPLDFNKLGIPRISFPVGLKFSLTDGIYPLPNRESIRYSNEAKKIIMDKIAIIADHFIEKYNTTIKDSDDINAIFSFYNSSSRSVMGFDGRMWDVNCLQKYSKIQFLTPKMKDVEKLNLQRLYHMKDYIVQEWEKGYEFKTTCRTKSPRLSTLKNKWNRQMYFSDIQRDSVFYTYTEVPNKQKKDYIKDQLGGKHAYFIEKYRSYSLKGKELNNNLSTYYSILQLKSHPKTEWRQIIKEFQYIQSLVFKDIINIDTLVVPQQWVDDKKKQKVQLMVQKGTNVRRKKLVGEVTGRVATTLERYVSGKNCKFESNIIQLKDVEKSKYLTIYCENTEENENLIQKWFTVAKKDKIKFITFSSRELIKLKDLDVHNWMTMEKFLKGDNKSFRRIATAYLIVNLSNKYNSVFSGTTSLAKISTDLATKIDKLNDYSNDWYIRGDDNLYKAILEVAESKDLFDKSIHDVYKSVKFTLERLPFINPIFSNISSYRMEDDVIEAIRDLFKYHKTRIDWQHYGLKINEEVKIPLQEEEL